MPPKAKAKPKAVRQTPAVSTKASRKESGEKNGHTLLEIEAASNGSAKRGRRNCDDKAAVLKIMNDHFKSLSVDEKFVTKVEGLSLEEKIDFDRGRWMKGEITMGKNYYADLRRLYSNEETPFRSIKVTNADESDDEDLENALFQSSKHLAEYDPLYLWLALEKLPNQKNAAGLMKCFVTFDPYAGQGKNELFLRTLRWCKVVELSLIHI